MLESWKQKIFGVFGKRRVLKLLRYEDIFFEERQILPLLKAGLWIRSDPFHFLWALDPDPHRTRRIRILEII